MGGDCVSLVEPDRESEGRGGESGNLVELDGNEDFFVCILEVLW